MPPIATLAQVIVLFGTTLLIIFIDKAYRARHPPEGIPMAEPSTFSLILLTVLCNLVTLPVYFYQTRRSALWALVGIGAFLFCLGASVATGIVVALIAHAAG